MAALEYKEQDQHRHEIGSCRSSITSLAPATLP